MEKPELDEEKTPPAAQTEGKPPETSRPVSRFQKLLRTALYMLAGALVLFLAGALVIWLVFTRPAQAGLRQAAAELEKEKTASQQKIDDLSMKVESLSSLETRNRELEQELGEARQQIALLNTLTDVMTARIELAGKNNTGVRQALNNASKSLTSLESLVKADQKNVVKAMQDRLKLVVGEFETNAFAAESDLDVLIENLKQLKN